MITPHGTFELSEEEQAALLDTCHAAANHLHEYVSIELGVQCMPGKNSSLQWRIYDAKTGFTQGHLLIGDAFEEHAKKNSDQALLAAQVNKLTEDIDRLCMRKRALLDRIREGGKS